MKAETGVRHLKMDRKPPEARERLGGDCSSQPSAGINPANTLEFSLQNFKMVSLLKLLSLWYFVAQPWLINANGNGINDCKYFK